MAKIRRTKIALLILGTIVLILGTSCTIHNEVRIPPETGAAAARAVVQELSKPVLIVDTVYVDTCL